MQRHLRHQLGFHLVVGLEFLVAADIVEALLVPSLELAGAGFELATIELGN
jgi:uncharacterized membrane protein